MKKVKKYSSIITQVLLTLSIILIIICIFTKYIVFNKFTYINILSKNNIYTQVKDAVYEKIDATLKAKKIDYDVKEDIITEDDIKKEADNAISGIIQYLETGKNDVKPIDAELYKQRVAAILHSAMDNIIKPDKNNLSLNANLNFQNTSYIKNNQKLNEMMLIKRNIEDRQGSFRIEKLMSKEEAEARVREILKQKGLTEEQAIKKAEQKGITEEQALKILASYGITIDGLDDDGNNSKNQKSGTESKQENNKENSPVQGSNNAAGNDGKQVSNSQGESGSNSSSIVNKSAKMQLAELENKLLDEADSSIEKEIEKVDFNKVLESSKFQEFAMVTAILYKLFWLITVLPVIFMGILLIEERNFKYSLKRIGVAFLSSGLILSIIFGCAYVSKIYEKINIVPAYFKETFSYIMRYFIEVLFTLGIATFIIGLLLIIPTIVMLRSKKRKLLIHGDLLR